MTQELADLFGLALPEPFKRQAHKTAGYQPESGLFKSPKRETKESFLARMSKTLINSGSEE
jgi:hypothetical protein